MYICLYTIYIPSDQTSQKSTSNHLDLELQVVLRHLMWVLGKTSWTPNRSSTIESTFQNPKMSL